MAEAQQKNLTPKEQALNLPKEPGVYLMKNAAGVIIYIGKAKVLKARVSSYFNKQKGRPLRLKHLISQIVSVDYMVTGTEVEAFLLEASLIKKHRPKYNIRLKDDKSYPYIKFSLSEAFPRLSFSRKVTSGKDVYYGPYTSSYLVRENIRFLNGLYKIRDCKNSFMKSRKRPCLSYEIKRCTAPCVDYVSSGLYKKQIEKALDFLNGRSEGVVKDLEVKMREAAKREDFEEAAVLRDQFKAAKLILEKQSVVLEEDVDRDVITYKVHEKGTMISMLYVRKGRVLGNKSFFISRIVSGVEESLREKILSFLSQYYVDNFIPDEILLDYDLGRDLSKLFIDVLVERKKKDVNLSHVPNGSLVKLLDLSKKNLEEHLEKQVHKSEQKEAGLEEIQKKLGLKELPLRIECYDISNFQGAESVGSQVVFNAGAPSPEDYRIYKIKTVSGSDDFESIKEVLSRRLRHTEYQDPQLIVIDGGKGQLAKAVEALKDLKREDLAVVGLAKSREKGDFLEADLKRTEERFFLPGRSNPVTFKSYSEGLKILTQIRDEAHRFAITHHRKLRDKKTHESAFEGLPGLGPKSLERLRDYLQKQKDWSLIQEEDLRKKLKLKLSVAREVLLQISELLKKEENDEV